MKDSKTKDEESTRLVYTGCSLSLFVSVLIVVYYESRKRELKIRLMNEGRCDERLKGRVEESTCLT